MKGKFKLFFKFNFFRIPPPKTTNGKFEALIFDSWFDKYRGAIALILVKQGSISKNSTIRSFINQKEYQVGEIGVMHPEMVQVQVFLIIFVDWVHKYI